eukprot:3108864-Pleurochrysis_carterae.AAC.2
MHSNESSSKAACGPASATTMKPINVSLFREARPRMLSIRHTAVPAPSAYRMCSEPKLVLRANLLHMASTNYKQCKRLPN